MDENMEQKNSMLTRVMFMGDFHVPCQDDDAINLALNFMKSFKPHILVLGGDLLDLRGLSKFPKDLKTTKAQDEIDVLGEILRDIRIRFYRINHEEMPSDVPKRRIVWIGGNHEARMHKIGDVLLALEDMESLSFRRIFGLDNSMDDGVRYVKPYPFGAGVWKFRNFIFKHGEVVRKWAGRSAQAEFDLHLQSGMSGHCHRSCPYYTTRDGHEFVWVEAGHLCNPLKLRYGKTGSRDWMQGIGVVTFFSKNRFHASAIPIIRNHKKITMIYGEKQFSVPKTS